MAYTVKELAKLSGVTERTICWYDNQGVLKPAYLGTNGYRYYEEKELLLLQQILFFRALDFSLNEIRRIVTGDNFDQIKSLNAHKNTLLKRFDHIKTMVKTIDKTINHIRGKRMMEDNEMYTGFRDWAKNKGSESYFIGKCDDPDHIEDHDERIVYQNVRKDSGIKRDEGYYKDLEDRYNEVYKEIVNCLTSGFKANSEETQTAIGKHHNMAHNFYNCSKKVYRSLAQVYLNKEEFRDQLTPFHPELPEYIAKAMDVYSDNNL